MKIFSFIVQFFLGLLGKKPKLEGGEGVSVLPVGSKANAAPPQPVPVPLIRVALDIGHKYKTSKPNDRGASSGDLIEADIAETYVHLARRYLNGSRIEGVVLNVYIPSPSGSILVGEYSERHKWANDHLIDLYIQAHVNAGGGSYAWMGHNGLGSAREVAKSLGGGLVDEFSPAIDRYVLSQLSSGERGWACISGVSCPAIVYEPCFLDNPIHAKGLSSDWMERIAKVLSNSIKSLITGGVIDGRIGETGGGT